MNNTKQILNDLGLGDKEIEVYLELAQNRSLSALQISKETGIDRTTVYDILNKMINKGIASSISMNKTTMYNCLEPEKLFLHFKEKCSALEGILPELTELYKKQKNVLICETFQGIEGLKSVLRDMISSNADYKVIGIKKEYEDILNFFHEQGILKVNQAKIKETAIVEKGIKFKKIKSGTYKIVKKLSAPVTTIIYKDIVIFLIWTNHYYAIRIKNNLFKNGQEECFNLLWKNV